MAIMRPVRKTGGTPLIALLIFTASIAAQASLQMLTTLHSFGGTLSGRAYQLATLKLNS
jgi:hypothetical protein